MLHKIRSNAGRILFAALRRVAYPTPRQGDDDTKALDPYVVGNWLVYTFPSDLPFPVRGGDSIQIDLNVINRALKESK